MSKLEAATVRRVKDWCDKNGVLFIKFTPFGSRGWPDTILVFPGGFHLWVELKRKGKAPRKLQLYRMEKLNSMGALAVWFEDADQCIDYLEDCLASAMEVQNESTVDTPQIPTKGDTDLGEAVRGGATTGSGDGKDSDSISIFRGPKGV